MDWPALVTRRVQQPAAASGKFSNVTSIVDEWNVHVTDRMCKLSILSIAQLLYKMPY